jgi:Tol biopolymer transport system component
MRRIAFRSVPARSLTAILTAAGFFAGSWIVEAADPPATKAPASAASTAAAKPAAASKLDHPDDRVAPWRKNVTIKLVGPARERHTSHAYYVCNPESPDGRRVVYFSSTAANAHTGEVVMLDRTTGEETVLATGVNAEDAHRGACQQWTLGGKAVAFHDVQNGRWSVSVVDVDTGKRRVVAEDHQLGFGRGDDEWLPVYGCHWNPGPYRDLELVHAVTGERKTVMKVSEVESRYADWVKKEFAGKQISIFFPVVSPDHQRVFFKIAAGNGGDIYMSKGASHRQGIVAYDMETQKITWMREKWGHPAWHPDSRQIIEVGNFLFDSIDGTSIRIPELPTLNGTHPSVSPDGKIYVTDGQTTLFGGGLGEWGILVGDLRGKHHVLLHRFQNNRGAKSWRVSHPHPVFSADGKRVYFNVSAGDWTQLHVAELGDGAVAGK